jgi:ADP-heptose:LPS heptosyltransferase
VKILLAKRRALGDTVLLAATADLLAATMPEAEIQALVPRAFAAVLEGHPAIKRVHEYEESWLRLVPRLRGERFDYFFQLHASPNTRWLARFAGAKVTRFHFQNATTERAYGKHPNALEWDAFFLRGVFGERITVPAPNPRIYLSAGERNLGAGFWRRWQVDGKRVIVLGLGASRPTKRWPAAHFGRLAELLRDRMEAVLAILAGPGEEEAEFAGRVVDEMRALGLRPREVGGTKGDFIYTAGLGVRELAGALSAARAYVGNDSGPKHIAAAVGIPTYTFFGPEDPEEWHPYARDAHPVFFLEGLACRREDNGRWCGISECKTERHRCMVDLTPLDVVEPIRRSLEAR